MVSKRQIENITLALSAWGSGHLVTPFEELLAELETLRAEAAARASQTEVPATVQS